MPIDTFNLDKLIRQISNGTKRPGPVVRHVIEYLLKLEVESIKEHEGKRYEDSPIMILTDAANEMYDDGEINYDENKRV